MDKLGVIFTDTWVLADKYHCQPRDVEQLLLAFVRDSESQGVEWQMVDVGGHDFDYIFNQNVWGPKDVWKAYAQALNDYCAGMGWKTDYRTPLFIVGGDDVIPMPIFDLPSHEGNSPVSLQADMLYAYHHHFNIIDEVMETLGNGYLFSETMLSKSFFNVSRLPLENGDILTSIQQDLGDYFSRSVDSGGCIKVDSLLPTSAYNWYMSVRGITENLPLLPLGPDTRCRLSDIVISPNHNMGDSAALQEYTSAISKADMLLFNTHGSNRPEQSGFMGQGPAPEPGDERISYVEYPLAFDVELLPYCRAKILATLSCYGARFYNYQRQQSMLLSAIYGDFLLYMGSCEVALGRGGVKDPGNALRLTGYSETLMKIYINLLMEGEPAGLALLKAKWRYLEECIGEDSPTTALYTIFEFNQFGNPALKVIAPRYNRQRGDSETKMYGSSKVKPPIVLAHKFTTLYSSGISELDALYQDVRNTLDKTLLQLSFDLCQMLQRDYSYSSTNLFLTSVVRIDESSGIGGYLFQYLYEQLHNRDHSIYVRVDGEGRLKDVIHTI